MTPFLFTVRLPFSYFIIAFFLSSFIYLAICSDAPTDQTCATLNRFGCGKGFVFTRDHQSCGGCLLGYEPMIIDEVSANSPCVPRMSSFFSLSDPFLM